MNSEVHDSSSPEVTLEAQAAPSSPSMPAAEVITVATELGGGEASVTLDNTDTKDVDAIDVKPEDFNATVRVAKESSVRKLISFVMYRLERGGTVTIQALNLCVHKAITIALITRDRIGNVFQVNSLLVVEENNTASKADDDQQQE